MCGAKSIGSSVSVIIPVYQDVTGLKRCLFALRKSRFNDPVEIIVVDDASPAEGEQIACITKLHKARLVRLSVNSGPAVARNSGAKSASGAILVFIDADCLPEPGWLEEITWPVRTGQCGATTSCYSKPVWSNWLTDFQNDDYHYRMPREICSVRFLNSCNMAIDKKLFLAAGGFPDQRTSEDMMLGEKLAEMGQPAQYLPFANIAHDYHRRLRGYLGQRFAFAFYALTSAASKRIKKEGSHQVKVRTFNPARVAAASLLHALALLCLLLTLLSAFWAPWMTMVLFGAGSLFLTLETLCHARFLKTLIRNQGWRRLPRYLFLLYALDFTYLVASVGGFWFVIRGRSQPERSVTAETGTPGLTASRSIPENSAERT